MGWSVGPLDYTSVLDLAWKRDKEAVVDRFHQRFARPAHCWFRDGARHVIATTELMVNQRWFCYSFPSLRPLIGWRSFKFLSLCSIRVLIIAKCLLLFGMSISPALILESGPSWWASTSRSKNWADPINRIRSFYLVALTGALAWFLSPRIHLRRSSKQVIVTPISGRTKKVRSFLLPELCPKLWFLFRSPLWFLRPLYHICLVFFFLIC